MDKSDIKLINSAKSDKSQFEALYKKYIDKIYNYFWYRIGHNHEIAEDLAQETFVRAYEHLPKFQIRKVSYYSYLLTIAHNVLVNYYRKPQAISLESVGEVPEEVWGNIEKKDASQMLWRAIQQLSDTERDVLYLKYRNEHKVKEIAKIMNKSENAIKLILSRVRKKLKKHPYISDISQFSDKKRKATKGLYSKL